MKNRKWLTYTLGALLTLVVLGAVAVTSYRIGMAQNISFPRPAFAPGNGQIPRIPPQGNPDNYGGNQFLPGNPRGDDSRQFAQNGNKDKSKNPAAQWNSNGGRVKDRGNNGRGWGAPPFKSRGSFFRPIFGLVRLIVLGLIIWGIYWLIKKSGWRLTRVEPAPVSVQTVSVEKVGKKKASK